MVWRNRGQATTSSVLRLAVAVALVGCGDDSDPGDTGQSGTSGTSATSSGETSSGPGATSVGTAADTTAGPPGTTGGTTSSDSTGTGLGTTSQDGTTGTTGTTGSSNESSSGTTDGGSSSSGGGGPGCGNGAIDPGEQCDGANLQGFDCATLGLGGGVLVCNPMCLFDASGCGAVGPMCGDGSVDPGEQCDGADLQGFDCASLGLGGGVLACDPMLCVFDTSMCMPMGGTGS